ncbi:MAG TPA: alanine racemase [Candidatus Limnocylindrales bacterium]|jgi:D-serine deaminase-like pyridoxal phosphate-dependent protein|nr:alanine racemase [Candidatus Limnocylindrales bacterium]
MSMPAPPANLDTPCLVVDLDAVDRNLRRMAVAASERGVALRPHVKTHKSLALARMQLEAGAAGVTVGTIGEAEVMADGGIDDIFIAYPVWVDGPKSRRLRDVHERSSLAVGVDSPEAAELLAAAVEGSERRLRVLVELDSGTRRSGVASPDAALRVARKAREVGLQVIGVFTHGGHGYQAPWAGAAAAADEVAVMGAAAAAFSADGFPMERISAGSTPTAVLAATGAVNEIRPGTYIFGDRTQLALGSIPANGIGLIVAATVVSTAVPGQVVLDAGAKTLTKDRADYLEGFGLLADYPRAILERLYDYHAAVIIPPGSPSPRLGEVVTIVPNHVCPVVEQFDEFVVTRNGRVAGRWPVDARGRSR